MNAMVLIFVSLRADLPSLDEHMSGGGVDGNQKVGWGLPGQFWPKDQPRHGASIVLKCFIFQNDVLKHMCC